MSMPGAPGILTSFINHPLAKMCFYKQFVVLYVFFFLFCYKQSTVHMLLFLLITNIKTLRKLKLSWPTCQQEMNYCSLRLRLLSEPSEYLIMWPKYK